MAKKMDSDLKLRAEEMIRRIDEAIKEMEELVIS